MQTRPDAVHLAKITRPRPGAVLLRARLLRDLDEGRDAPCTWIAAPPGSGKTLLLSSFVAQRPNPSLWYQVDPGDGDPAVFFAYLSAAAATALGLAADALPRFTADAAFGLMAFARGFFRQLFALAPELTLVFDDFHEAPDAGPLHDIVRVLIEQTPWAAQVLVASRSPPSGKLARLAAHGAVRQLAGRELLLTAEEVVGIAALHGTSIDAAASMRWLDRCDGWVAGLRLLLRPATSSGLRLSATESSALLFDYLEHEVFRKLPAAEQSLLLRLAVLPRMPVDVIEEFEPATAAVAHLAALTRQNLFVTVSGEAPLVYRFHPLFREFLLHQAQRDAPDRDALLESSNRVARALSSRGLVEDAAQVLIEAGSWQELTGLVSSEARACMALGRVRTLERWLLAFPTSLLDGEPWLLYWLGISGMHQHPAAGRARLERAYEIFDARQDTAGLLLAWSGVVDCIFHQYLDLRQFDPWIARLDRMLDSGLAIPAGDVEARVSFSMFVALAFHQPHHPNFAAWRCRLRACADAAPDPIFRLLARLYLMFSRIWSGDLYGAAAALGDLKRESDRRATTTPFVDLVERLAESSLALYAGDIDDCFEAIDSALAIAQESGVHLWDKVLLGQGAALALSHGDISRGRAFAARRGPLASEGDMEEQSLYHTIEAWAFWLAGRRAEALAQARASIEASERMGLPHFTGINALTLTIVSFDCGDPAMATQQLALGRAIGKLTSNPMLEWFADLLESYMRLRQGASATALIAKCMALGRQHGFRHFFFWPRRAVALVCAEALSRSIGVDHVLELITKGRLELPAEAAYSEHWPRPVKVYTLGRFEVMVNGAPLRFAGKAQRVPLNLLKAIIALGGHEVPQHRLVDALWPDAEGDAGEQALATTLSRLRKLIGLAAVRRQAGQLSLDSSICWVDCLALQQVTLRSSHASAELRCEQIGQLYRGEFLPGESDAPWVLTMRERLHVGMIKLLSRGGDAALHDGQYDRAAEFFELGLGVDDLVESFYAGLIRCYLHSGQPSLAIDVYHRCRQALSTRLGVAPSDATSRLYRDAITCEPKSG